MTLLENLKEYSSLISAALSLTALGFLVHIAKLIRDAAKDKIEILEARNNSVVKEAEAQQKLLEKENQILKQSLENQILTLKDDVARTDKWHLRDIERLKGEISKYEEQLKGSLNKENIDLNMLISASSKGISENVRQSLETIIYEMLSKIGKINELTESATPEQHLELGKGLMAIGKWKEAAEQLDKYTQIYPFDWEVQFSKGVAYANSRESLETNLSALRAYNESIGYFCKNKNDVDTNIKARLFTYRGAILKRLDCIEESEANLMIAKKLATNDYECRDAIYNLACIYAMKADKEKLLETIKLLKNYKGYKHEMGAIKWHLNDYFLAFREDKDFLDIIEINQ